MGNAILMNKFTKMAGRDGGLFNDYKYYTI